MRRLISFIRFESLEVSLLITYTTAILSEWSTIDVFVSNEPQISTARIIGKIHAQRCGIPANWCQKSQRTT